MTPRSVFTRTRANGHPKDDPRAAMTSDLFTRQRGGNAPCAGVRQDKAHQIRYMSLYIRSFVPLLSSNEQCT